jgi:uncharacterized protein (UPF0332 family)
MNFEALLHQAPTLQYRPEQAGETLREAEISLNEEALCGAINRFYYVMFYVLLALLTTLS